MKKKIATLSLMAGTFFCPLGYDILFKMTMDWTGGYWFTTLIFYFLSVFFFGLSYYLLKSENG